MTARDEAYLVLLAQAGDRDALGELLERVQSRLRGYLRFVTRDEARADDVLQDAFVIAGIFWLTVAIEAGLIAGFLALADFSDRTHMLFISSMAVYSTVALGVAGLNMRLEQGQRRLLEALKLRSDL